MSDFYKRRSWISKGLKSALTNENPCSFQQHPKEKSTKKPANRWFRGITQNQILITARLDRNSSLMLMLFVIVANNARSYILSRSDYITLLKKAIDIQVMLTKS